jgi:hypothetical protein
MQVVDRSPVSSSASTITRREAARPLPSSSPRSARYPFVVLFCVCRCPQHREQVADNIVREMKGDRVSQELTAMFASSDEDTPVVRLLLIYSSCFY